MTPQDHSTNTQFAMESILKHGLEGLPQAITHLVNEAMKIERSQFMEAAPYERTSARHGSANGFKEKGLNTRLGKLTLQVPQVRGLPQGSERFYPNALERGSRSEKALVLAIAEMYVQGVSTRKVEAVLQELCGLEITSTQVSRAAELLDAELQVWRNREIGEIPFLYFDARYEKVRHGGSVIDCAVLIASGIQPDGRRIILGVSVSLSEAEVHWRDFMQSLTKRGLRGVRMITSDAHAGLRAAMKACLTGVSWQRCQFHLQQNAVAYVPKKDMRATVAMQIRAMFQASSLEEARRLLKLALEDWERTAPDLANWAEEALPEGFSCYALPQQYWKRTRTNNMLERLNREIKRRTRVATLFPNAASALRLITAMLAEQSEEWEAGRRYIDMGLE